MFEYLLAQCPLREYDLFDWIVLKSGASLVGAGLTLVLFWWIGKDKE